MKEVFNTQVVAKGVWYIEDSRGGVMYLVAGTERALLIDTGWGPGDLSALVATLTPLPLVVVNTHAHPDHMGGNGQFPQIYIHLRDLPAVQDTVTRHTAVYDGYCLDLGQRQVRVIGVPGHTPGSICLLDTETRIVFTGDSPRPGPIWLHVGSALSVQEFSFSMKRLRTFAGDFDTIAPSHGKPGPAGTLIEDLVTCASKIVSGELVGKPQETRFGECLLAEYGSAGIMYRADKINWRFEFMRGDRIISPEVHADRTVTFRVKAPKADRVLLTSGPLMNALGSADNAMAFQDKDAAGVWSLTVGPLPPDLYDYSFVTDGVAIVDSNNPAVKTGTMSPSSVLTVPADDGGTSFRAYFEARDVPHGTLHRHHYTSKTLGDVRDVFVYTPPDYDADSDERYPVLYLLHGGGDNAAGWSDLGRAHLIMDNLLAEGKAKPMIIVMPFGQALPFMSAATGESVWQGMARNAMAFEQDLFTDIMPLVESTYRIEADRAHRALAGLSMGGGQTDQIGLSHLDTFSHIGILSIGAQGFAERHADLLADPAATNAKLGLLFLGCGTLDPLASEGMDELHRLLTEKGIEHVYWTCPGAAHTWVVWRTALYHELLPRLWRK